MIKVNDRLAISKENVVSVEQLTTNHKGDLSIKVTYNNSQTVFISCGKDKEEAKRILDKIIAEAD